MKFFKENEEQQLHKTLKDVYFGKENIEVALNSHWRMDVMRDIRRLGPLNAQTNPLQFFNRVVWRFATVACMLTLILCVYVGFQGWNPVDDVAALFLDNPIEFTVAQALGEYDAYE